jgi:sulfur carrier protein
MSNTLLKFTKGGNMKIIVTDGMGSDEEKEINTESITGKDLLELLDISVFVATIMKNNEIVGENEILTSQDKIKILNMIHGG